MAGRTLVSDLAFIDTNGNLTLGVDTDDAAGDSTHAYAKDDIWCPVPLSSLLCAVGATANWVQAGGTGFVVARAAGAVGGIPLVDCATNNTAYKILIPLVPPTGFRTYAGSETDPYGNSITAPHGAKLLNVDLNYRPVTGALVDDSVSAVFFTEAMTTTSPAAGTARAAQAAYGGTVLYEQPLGTEVVAADILTALPTTAANFHFLRVKPTTPAFINTDRTLLYMELALSTNASSGTCEISNIVAHWSVALY